ncbi:DUF5763 domain-containing protein [Pedobacter africanus]|uniref:DUF5763 domain-containing protein n=1 Tax=Pedobacter africanus TaxID=151894 RepID=UPI003394320A
MKNLTSLVVLCSILSFTNVSAFKETEVSDSHVATCTGSKSCYACSSCRYCKYCNAGGGNCSVCAPNPAGGSKNSLFSGPAIKRGVSSSSQCKGVTKKGARCKRMVTGGGYCWQHK